MIVNREAGQGRRRRVRTPTHPYSRPSICVLFFLLFLFPLESFSQFSGSFSKPTDHSKIRLREVANISIVGNDSIPTATIIPLLATKVSSGFDVFLNWINSSIGLPRQFVAKDLIALDTEKIYLLYRERGYLDANVTYRLIEDPESVEEWQSVHEENLLLPPSQREDYPTIETTVEFVVDQGPQFVVGGFSFEGLENLPPDLLQEATNDIGIKLNTPYSEAAVKKEYTRVETFLEEHGYPFFNRDSAFTDRTSPGKVVTTIHFNTGNRYKLGNIHIVYEPESDTTSTVDEKTIRRLLTIQSGEWFQNSKMNESERYLYELGTFDAARIGLDTSVVESIPYDKRDGMALPVIVSLRMRSTADFAAGVSVTSGSIGTAFGVKGAYNNRNIFFGGESFSASGSYQIFPVNQVSWDLTGSFGFPYIGFRNVPVQVGVTGSRFAQFEKETKVEQMDISSLAIPVTTRLSIFRTEEYRSTLGLGVSFEKIVSEITDSSLIADYEQISKDPQLNLIISGDYVIDGTNDIFNPSRGSSYTISSEIGTPYLAIITGSTLPSAAYWKNSLQIRNFQTMTDGGAVLASRVYAGYAHLTDPESANRDVPQIRKFLGGGMTSFRGWPSRSLLVSNIGTSTIIGGYTTLGAGAEYRFTPFKKPQEITTLEQLAGPIVLAFFSDVGNVWDKETPINIDNVSVTGGIGFRYNTPFGPLRVDWGFKFYDPYPGLIRAEQQSFPTSTQGEWIFKRDVSFGNLFDVSFIGFTIGNAF